MIDTQTGESFTGHHGRTMQYGSSNDGRQLTGRGGSRPRVSVLASTSAETVERRAGRRSVRPNRNRRRCSCANRSGPPISEPLGPYALWVRRPAYEDARTNPSNWHGLATCHWIREPAGAVLGFDHGLLSRLCPRARTTARRPSVKVGLQVPSFTWPGGDAAIGETLARVVETADGVGFDSLWGMDYRYQIRGVGPAAEPMLEGWTTLGFMAAHSKQATLGLMVGGIHYRLPGIWAKAATTLDVLSGGRAYLGIGAAWNEEDLSLIHIGR